MKNTIRACLCALLCALLLFGTASAEVYSANAIYTITYDDSVFTLDNTSYQDENTSTYEWMFMLYSDETVVDASCELIEAYQDLTLFSADEGTRQAYKADLLDSFSDQDAQFCEVREVSAYKIPFYIIKCEDDDGEYYMAETVVKGRSLDFLCYPADGGRVRDVDYAVLCEILGTFEPVLQ